MTTLYIATTNPGKLRDFAAAATTFLIEPLPNLATIPPPPEDALTFAENAIAKAIYYSRAAPGLTVLADDSGLEVDALQGAPGVRSARFADDRHYITRRPLPPDQRNNLCLLDALASTRDGRPPGPLPLRPRRRPRRPAPRHGRWRRRRRDPRHPPWQPRLRLRPPLPPPRPRPHHGRAHPRRQARPQPSRPRPPRPPQQTRPELILTRLHVFAQTRRLPHTRLTFP